MRIVAISRYSYRRAASIAAVEKALFGGQCAEIIGSVFTPRGLPFDGPG
jgi:hypothetical protein